MELDVNAGGRSAAVTIDQPFHLDMDGIMQQIGALLAAQGIAPDGLDIRDLIPQMVRGVAGCEAGCPADAKRMVERGFGSFKLEYVEGGILTASVKTKEGKMLILKLFPDF